ncbi:TolC family protein [Candidatus Eisenbacteria bacterium]|uniref:TolC family protein n=1 Tax=Eiseniibacteriota bacterium TaxID=2212470 RepID=A0ABV6YIZ0_UNCEI
MSERKFSKEVCAFLAVAMLMYAATTAHAAQQSGEEEQPALGRGFTAYTATDPDKWDPAQLQEQDAPVGVLTLENALTHALARSARLASFSWSTRAAEAHASQSGLLPNPEFGVEVEGFGGAGESREFETAEMTFAISQLVELGGKRGKRKKLASLEAELAARDYELHRLDLISEVTLAFGTVLAAQERVALAGEQQKLQETTLSMVSERVAAGKDVPADQTQAEIDLASVRIQSERAKRVLAAARQELVALWGGKTTSFDRVSDEGFTMLSPPSEEQVLEIVSASPDLTRGILDTERHRAAVSIEGRQRVPDLELSGGVRHAKETGDESFVAGLSFALPLFDRNQGALRASKCDLAGVQAEQLANEAEVRAAVLSATNSLSSAFLAVHELEETILPGAERTVDAVVQGYRTGKLSYLRVIQIQQTLYTARSEYVDAREEYYSARATLERLLGVGLESLVATEDRR